MTVHHDKPIGVDAFFREIFAGDTVRDLDGKEYTIDERGYAKSLDGVTVTGFKRLKDPVFVRGSAQAAVASKFQEKDGKVGPAVKVEISGPTGDVPLKDEIAAMEPAPAPGPDLIEGYAPRKGGRENKSGFSQICNIAGRYGFHTKEARDLCVANGIEVFTHGSQKKAHIRVEDLQRFKDLLLQASGRAPDPGNYGAHRPNESGYTSFANLARSLKVPAWTLRNFAKDHGFAIVRPGNGTRNDGVRIQEEGRFRELWAAEHGKPVQVQAVEVRPLEVPENVVKTLCSIDTGETRDWNLATAPDQALADELRRRGYEVTATKRIEL